MERGDSMTLLNPRGMNQHQADILNIEALELKALGYSQLQAAEKLGVGLHRIRLIHKEINKEWREKLTRTLMRDNISLEYGATIELNRLVIRKAFEVFETTTDKTGRVQLEALRVIADTNHRTGLLLGDSQLLARSIGKALVYDHPSDSAEVEEGGQQEEEGVMVEEAVPSEDESEKDLNS
jgi:hypothetical protein